MNNVFHLIGGDTNMVQNFELDTYIYDKWKNKRATHILKDKMNEFEVVDTWKKRKAGRLDSFFNRTTNYTHRLIGFSIMVWIRPWCHIYRINHKSRKKSTRTMKAKQRTA